MDLLSTASAAAAITVSCVKLGTLLYCWIEEIRDVDGTLKIFMGEVNALSAVLDTVKSWSQDAVVTDSYKCHPNKQNRRVDNNAIATILSTAVYTTRVSTRDGCFRPILVPTLDPFDFPFGLVA